MSSPSSVVGMPDAAARASGRRPWRAASMDSSISRVSSSMKSGTPSDLATITSRASGGSPVAAATAPASSADAAGDRLARFTTVTLG